MPLGCQLQGVFTAGPSPPSTNRGLSLQRRDDYSSFSSLYTGGIISDSGENVKSRPSELRRKCKVPPSPLLPCLSPQFIFAQRRCKSEVKTADHMVSRLFRIMPPALSKLMNTAPRVSPQAAKSYHGYISPLTARPGRPPPRPAVRRHFPAGPASPWRRR